MLECLPTVARSALTRPVVDYAATMYGVIWLADCKPKVVESETEQTDRQVRAHRSAQNRYDVYHSRRTRGLARCVCEAFLDGTLF